MQYRKDPGFVISRHLDLDLNLLVHIAGKILILQPLIWEGDYRLCSDVFNF